MNSNIYVRNKKEITKYKIQIDEMVFRQIIHEIDTFYGKGDLQKQVTHNLEFLTQKNSKVEIVSMKKLGQVYKGYTHDSNSKETKIYQILYYSFVPHPLSELASKILTETDEYKLSQEIQILLNWETTSFKQKEWIKRLLSSIHIQKLDIWKEDPIVMRKIQKIIDLFRKEKQEKYLLEEAQIENLIRVDERINEKSKKLSTF